MTLTIDSHKHLSSRDYYFANIALNHAKNAEEKEEEQLFAYSQMGYVFKRCSIEMLKYIEIL